MMRMMRMLPVPADLRPWVEAAVCVHTPPQLACSRFPALAGGMLVLRLQGAVRRGDGSPVPAAALLGAGTQPQAYGHTGAVHAVGLVLRPQAVPVLARTDGVHLVGQAHDLRALLGAGWQPLHDAVLDAGNDDVRLALLFDWVRRRVDDRRALDRRLQLQRLLHDACQPPAAASGSRRQLQRRCLHELGLPPKPLQTLLRLRAALHDGLAGHADGAELALRHGYYDQSHLARDLRRLAGAPLKQLRQGLAQPLSEHWALAAGRP